MGPAAFSKMTFALALVRDSRYPYVLCSASRRSGRVRFDCLHGNAVWKLLEGPVSRIGQEFSITLPDFGPPCNWPCAPPKYDESILSSDTFIAQVGGPVRCFHAADGENAELLREVVTSPPLSMQGQT